jgi:hypothetical protein
MSERVKLLLFVAVLLAFMAAVLLGFVVRGSSRAEGLLLVASGVCAVIFSRQLTEAQHALSEKPFVPRSWSSTRPLLYVLWGVGVVLLGVLELLNL